jgi:Secretion system C-terminal sorting domain
MKKLVSIFLVVCFAQLSIAQNENISGGAIFDGEPYIAMNPNNPDHLVVAWMGFESPQQRIQINYRVSFNGGVSWGATGTLPHVVAGYTAADPAILFADDGTLFITSIDSTGSGSNPLEGGIYLYTSTDGGLSFDPPTEVVNIAVAPEKIVIDRPWLAIDNTTTPVTLYVTSMNAEGATAPFHPYVSVSEDGGATFQFQELDGPGWLAGSNIPKPMPTPSVSSTGIFHAVYPSFVVAQNLLPQYVHVASTDGGATFQYNQVFQSAAPGPPSSLPKMGYLCRVNPSNPDHIIFVYLSNTTGDLDVTLRESYDGGISWGAAQRINDDPIANDRMQDLLWAAFDSGDLVISWRDRRNGDNETYETASEIWAAFRPNGATGFEANFQITDQTIPYDDVLANSGNDFMSIALRNDRIHIVWGDVRTNALNIWYQRMNTDGTTLGIANIASEGRPEILVFPNPSESILTLQGTNITAYTLYDTLGNVLLQTKGIAAHATVNVDLSTFATGAYFIEIESPQGIVTKKIIKK